MSDPQTPDRELTRLLGGDPDAICSLYDRHLARLVRLLLGAGADHELAWDIAQETFARLLERRDRIRVTEDGSAWPWLASCAKNLLRDWQRRGRVDNRARRKLGIDPIATTDEELDAALARLDGKRHTSELEQALADLPASQRAAVTARVLEEHDYAELAHCSATSEQTMRRRVSRGLHAMRTRLEGGQP